MRKVLLLSVVFAALVVACENKNPAGPGGVGPGGVTVTQTTSSTTTTTSTPTTTSTTTTTTTVTGSLSRRYVAFQPPPNVPADMTLFFQLLTTGISASSLLERVPFLNSGPHAVTENRYKVTGVYVMGNGTSGTVDGELSGAADPLQTGGNFDGSMTANVPGCTAERNFSGALGPQTLTWSGGTTRRDCAGSPLAFQSFTLLRGDAQLPATTTTTVPATSTTTSTTTTTTAIVCSYTLSPTSASVPATGGSGPIVVGTLPTCPWTAQSFASWLSVTPASGAGAGSVTFTAAANVNGPARSGTIVIAGQTFTVNQSAPPAPDLTITTWTCGFDASRNPIVTVPIHNGGVGPATVASVARILFFTSNQTSDQTVGAPLAAGADAPVTYALPATCFADGTCSFSVTADANAAVFESNEGNNSLLGSCPPPVIGATGAVRR